jgi:hypothetical protein
VRTIVAVAALSLSGLLGYIAYTLHRSNQRHPPGISAEYMEHLFVIGGITFRPLVAIGSFGIAAALFFALAIYLLIAERG